MNREKSETLASEQKRLAEAREGRVAWKKWGPYLSERQWGTVREDYSENGDAWNFFTHDHARSRAYRWGEDGFEINTWVRLRNSRRNRFMRWLKTITLSAVLISLFIGNARASEIIASADVVDAPIVAGLGIAMIPDYVGSDDYRAAPLPFLKYTFNNSQRYIKLSGPELSINLLNHPNFYLGPVVRYYGSRDDDIEDDVVKKMKEIDSGLSAGAFLTFEIKEADPRNKINLTLKFLADISDSYSGYLIDFDATLWRKVAQRWDVFIGAGATYADDDYMNTYFSVNNGNRGSATVLELPNYSAGSGIRDIRAQAGATYYYNENWLFGGMVRAQTLLGDAEDSPVVDGRGDPNQMTIALFAGYRW